MKPSNEAAPDRTPEALPSGKTEVEALGSVTVGRIERTGSERVLEVLHLGEGIGEEELAGSDP